MADFEKRSVDPASLRMMSEAGKAGLRTVWDRSDEMEPRCGFGTLGVCCRICMMGPCRINPFDPENSKGVCGADADIIAARNLARMIAAGSAAHSDHGRDTAYTLLQTARHGGDYRITDQVKLRALAVELGVAVEGRTKEQIAADVAERCFAEFGQQHGELNFARRAPKKTQEAWRKAGVMPRGIDREIVEIMHRTTMGVDSDPENILLQGVRAALADGWGGSMIATEISDVLFGSPKPIRSKVNLGVLNPRTVNLVVHGHEPTLSDIIVSAANDPELVALARSKGAEGISLAGICCTANEILMRHGIPIAGNHLQQELAIATGIVDAMVVDVQCVMPSLVEVAGCFHTRLISTSPKAKLPGAEHVEFTEEKAYETAKKIVRIAVENFLNRSPEKMVAPDVRERMVAGFTTENAFRLLGGKYRSTYRPLNDAIIAGRLRGAVGIVGCNNPRVTQDWAHLEMCRELIKNDVLVVETGCSAIACAKAGLLQPEAKKYCGAGLQEICEAVGIPPVLHLGSCVDNSRILTVLTNIVAEGGLGDSLADLPVAGAAPEWMSEKAVAIGFYVAASGVLTVLGLPFPVEGAPRVMKWLTEDMEKRFGGKFAFESDPIKAAHIMIDHIDRKRKALGLRPMMYPQPYKAAAAD
ncbi:MAG: anaerobic carbon-monoxide dehydrogenase catalytic subunit [Planctomycetota bacterium]|nr:anaerobic carbon-monoxide dehydrogenase catalytic subunit [Planctomycetota bacterium]